MKTFGNIQQQSNQQDNYYPGLHVIVKTES